jgi:hypothetical protein
VGGNNEYGTRGQAVEIRIDPEMLTHSQQVTSVWIANCNVGEQLSREKVLSGMPMGITDLNLRNTLMRVEPIDLSVLQNLRSLYGGGFLLFADDKCLRVLT